MGKFGELSENVVSNDVVIDCSRKTAIIPKIIYGGTQLMTSSIINPVEHAEITQQLSENIILTTVDDIYNWVKMSSLYPLIFGTACYFMEFMAAYASRFDLERYRMIPRAAPQQADMLITAGTITIRIGANQPSLTARPRLLALVLASEETGGKRTPGTDAETAFAGSEQMFALNAAFNERIRQLHGDGSRNVMLMTQRRDTEVMSSIPRRRWLSGGQ